MTGKEYFMNKIVQIAGFMLTQALDTIDTRGFLNPFFSGFKDSQSKVESFKCKDILLELAIPKLIRKFETNSENFRCAAIAYPADVEDDYGQRESAVIVQVKNYATGEFLIIAQPYKKDKKLEVYEYELFDFSPKLVNKLPEIEKNFIQGAYNYGDSKHFERFKRV